MGEGGGFPVLLWPVDIPLMAAPPFESMASGEMQLWSNTLYFLLNPRNPPPLIVSNKLPLLRAIVISATLVSRRFRRCLLRRSCSLHVCTSSSLRA